MLGLRRINSLAGALQWGMLCGCAQLTFDFLSAHLSFLSRAELASGLFLRGIAYAIGILTLGIVVRTLVPVIRSRGEEIEGVLGALAFLGSFAITCFRFLSITSFTVHPAIWIAILVPLELAALALMLRLVRGINFDNWRPGWSLRWSVMVFPVIMLTLFLFEFVNCPFTRFNLGPMVKYGAPAISGMIVAIVFYRNPHRIAPFIFLSVLFVMMWGLTGWSANRIQRDEYALRETDDVQKVIFITIDTLRYDMIFRPADKVDLAPNIRALLGDGVNFQHAVSPAPWTLTSFVSLMTGLEPLVHGRTKDHRTLPTKVQTLADVFSENHFQTRAVLFNYNLNPSFGLGRGFDQYVFAEADQVKKEVIKGASRLLGGKLAERLKINFPRDHTTEIARIGMDWISELRDQRYFLWLHFLDPHVPYSPPDRFARDLTTKYLGSAFDIKREEGKPLEFIEPDLRTWIRELYEAEVRYVDEKIAEIVALLRETGQYDDALIVFTSDHGEEFWEHGGFEHGHTLHQELLHVPLAFKLPSVGKKLNIGERVSTAQLAPSVLELCGLGESNEGMDYPSLVGLMDDDPATTGAMTAIWAGSMLYGDPQRAWIEGDMKLIVRNEDQLELFDMANDPEEIVNLAPTRLDEASAMMQRLLQHEVEAIVRRDALGIKFDAESEAFAPGVIEGLKDLGYM